MIQFYNRSVKAQITAQNIGAKNLFSGVSFDWAAPSLHVLMGPSGSGKSTLLKMLGGVWMPQEGDVRINGEALWDKNQELVGGLLAKMGFAFQNNALFSSFRVLENLMFPHRQRYPYISEKDRYALAKEWLQKVGLEASSDVFPHELSGGMQKRLGIARTLILEPEIIFLDDPTAGLDPITSGQMADLISKLLDGKDALVMIVTNDPDRAKNWGTHLHFLDQGEFLSSGHKRYSKVREEYL